MSRGLKAPFKPYEGRKTKDKHIRLTKNMMDSKVFRSLKPCTIIVYMYMKLWANGQLEFDYSKSLGSNVVAPATFSSAVRELENKGFIDRVYFSTGGGHKPNRYKFSDRWTKQ
ncbi:MAG: hypothetical protein IJJ82_07455 [Clostridia bacterium]|nr:hypothetical protein [Clostridia bacterium]